MISPKYTEVLCNIVNSGIDIFDFVYPIYNIAHKTELEDKIINHYYFYEIGSETVGRFKHNLKSVMNEIMPKYNQLYEYLDLNTINPISNIHIVETTSLTDTGSTTEGNTLTNDLTRTNNLTNESDSSISTDGTNAVDSTNTKKFSDTPQGQELTLDNGYLTNITSEIINNDEVISSDEIGNVLSTSTGTVKDTGTVGETKLKNENKTQAGTVTQSGFTGKTASEMLNEFMTSYNDVDVLIINELSSLFMRVY